MKTQTDNYYKIEAHTNKIMMVSILVFGIVLFFISGKNFIQNVFLNSENTQGTFNQNPNNIALIPLDDESTSDNNGLELNSQMLTDLAEIREPEMELVDLSNSYDKASFSENKYLAELYEQKNLEILEEIESNLLFQNYLVAENERELDVETWMTENEAWESNDQINGFEQNFAENAYGNMMKMQEFLAAEDEGILETEEWMASNVAWEMNEEADFSHNFAENTSGTGAEYDEKYMALLQSYLVVEPEEKPGVFKTNVENSVSTETRHEFSENRYLAGLMTAKIAEVSDEMIYNELLSFVVPEAEEPVNAEVIAAAYSNYGLNDRVTDWTDNHFLAELMNEKVTEVSNEIELNLLNSYLVLEQEKPLEMEKWMIDAKCWCKDPSQNYNFRYEDSFAMNTKNK